MDGGLTQSGTREDFSEDVALMGGLQEAWEGTSHRRHQEKGLPARGTAEAKALRLE